MTESNQIEMKQFNVNKYVPPIIEEEKKETGLEMVNRKPRSKSYYRESAGYGFFIFHGGLNEKDLENY